MSQISVIVCTRNRSRSLVATLHSLGMQTLSSADREIIVVDNGSTDETAELVEKLAEQVRPLRYVLEPRVGVSRARNAGIRASTGSIVAFIDDDATAAKDWLERILEAFSANPHAWAVGGRAQAVWPNGEPQWVSPSLRPFFSHVDLGDEPRCVGFPQALFGVNLAFRREAFEVLGVFSPALGRVGDSLNSGEEAEFCTRIDRAGKTLFYDPRVVVYHHVRPERRRKRWLIKRAFAAGRTKAVGSLYRSEYGSRLQWIMFAVRSSAAAVRLNVLLVRRLLTARMTSPNLMQEIVGASGLVGCAWEALRIAATNRTWVLDADIKGLYRKQEAESA